MNAASLAKNKLLPCRWSWLTKGYGSKSRKYSRLKSEITGQLAQNSWHAKLNIQYCHFPPWDPSPSLIIRDNLNNIGNKSDYTTEILKEAVNNIIRKQYPQNSWIRVYTDGSSEKATNNGGAGILIEWPNGEHLEKATAIGTPSDSTRAERKALELAARTLSSHPHSKNSQIVILTDAKTVLQSLTNPNSLINQTLSTELLKLRKISSELILQWIPGHVDLEGNDTADSLAKTGGRQNQADPSLHHEEIKALLKSSEAERWSKTKENHPKNDAFLKLPRQSQNIIFRLRTGHNKLRQHMFRKLRIGDSEMCPCGTAAENAEHVLQSCPLYNQARTGIWPQEASLEDKLFGGLDQLSATVQFISAIGLAV